MDIETLISMISSVGFPIIAWYLMWKQNTEVLKEMQKTIESNTTAFLELKNEISNMRKEVEDNED